MTKSLPSYRHIFFLSFPIMLGSAAQNIIALSDSVFLYHLSEDDFAAIGFVSVFYLVINAIGFGFSKGGQIMIARRFGERAYEQAGQTFRALVVFELILAVLMFSFIVWGTPVLFRYLVQSDIIYDKSLEYLEHRSWGVFFAYAGLCIIALYMGISRSKFIIYDTLVLAGVNIFLDYVLVYGKWGFPAMGIKGAGLASSSAEVVAIIVFGVYMIWDPKIKPLKVFQFTGINLQLIKDELRISMPIVIQYAVSVGSWFVFFSLVEKIGERSLAISNLGRMVYLILSIPCWGFASGVNTLVSNAIGRAQTEDVMSIIFKTAKISFAFTLVLSVPIIFFPEQFLYPLLGGEDMSLIGASQNILYIILGILMTFSISSIYFNGLSGTGATLFALKMQTFTSFVYLLSLYIIINVLSSTLEWAWTVEIFYWMLIFALSFYYLRSGKWQLMRV